MKPLKKAWQNIDQALLKVPREGLEPSRGCPQRFLRPSRLPNSATPARALYGIAECVKSQARIKLQTHNCPSGGQSDRSGRTSAPAVYLLIQEKILAERCPSCPICPTCAPDRSVPGLTLLKSRTASPLPCPTCPVLETTTPRSSLYGQALRRRRQTRFQPPAYPRTAAGSSTANLPIARNLS